MHVHFIVPMQLNKVYLFLILSLEAVLLEYLLFLHFLPLVRFFVVFCFGGRMAGQRSKERLRTASLPSWASSSKWVLIKKPQTT